MKTVLFFFTSFAMVACGVKGKPMPPLEPIPLGDGTLAAKKNEEKKRKAQTVKTAPREETPATNENAR